MTFLANILDGAVAFGVGVAVCLALWWWRERASRPGRMLERENLLSQARADAETIRRDAETASNRETLRLRTELEQSFVRRQNDLAEQERRLGEREALINTQLTRIMEAERVLTEKEEALNSTRTDLAAREKELVDLVA
jgi:hypothetical protein